MFAREASFMAAVALRWRETTADAIYVQPNIGFSFQIIEATLASPHVAHRRSSAILPIFEIGRIAEVGRHEYFSYVCAQNWIVRRSTVSAPDMRHTFVLVSTLFQVPSRKTAKRFCC